jgi:ABC-2 type transport system ATP-binding protein
MFNMSKKIKDEIVLKVSHVSKDFHLPHHKSDSIKSAIVNLFKRKDKGIDIQHALKDISVDIKKGEFFGIVGRNGSGKSTLLKIIAGIYRPTKGTVMTKGKLVPFIELGVGFNPELTGRENVYLNGALLGFSRREISARYNDIVAFAELENFMDQKLKNYSSGMQVRLAFSVAVRAEADILLVDEVLAVGDAAFQRKCYEYFKKLKKDKKTVIFVSHDMSAIREYCDKAMLIDESKIIFSGSSEDVAQEYTKLFVQSVYTAVETDEVNRLAKDSTSSSKWGSGGVDIIDLSLSKKVYATDDENVVLSYRIIGDPGFSDSVNPGIVIKDEQGKPVCGTNTDITFGRTRKLILDDKINKIDIQWIIPNIFNKGKYSIDVAVLSGSNGGTLQWWDESSSFRVINEKSTPYPVSPKISVNAK